MHMFKGGNRDWISNPDDLQEHINGFYIDLFAGSDDVSDFQSWGEFHSKKSDFDADNLAAPVCMEEIKKVFLI